MEAWEVDLWTAHVGRNRAGQPKVPYSDGTDLTGIAKRWREEPYRFGSVLGMERQTDEGVVQAFARAAIRWTPAGGAEVIE